MHLDPIYEQAACRESGNADLFASDTREDHLIAAQWCAQCPAMQACRAAGIAGHESGTWGGIYLTMGRHRAKFRGRPRKEATAA